jgi:hypothetical protein
VSPTVPPPIDEWLIDLGNAHIVFPSGLHVVPCENHPNCLLTYRSTTPEPCRHNKGPESLALRAMSNRTRGPFTAPEHQSGTCWDNISNPPRPDCWRSASE